MIDLAEHSNSVFSYHHGGDTATTSGRGAASHRSSLVVGYKANIWVGAKDRIGQFASLDPSPAADQEDSQLVRERPG